MSDTVLSTQWMFRIKAATRDLIARCGTLERASAICGRSTTRLGCYGSPDQPDIIPLPVALLLEAETGTPFVTEAMAAINGRTLSLREAAPAAPIHAAHVRVAQADSHYNAVYAEAAADGVITPREKTALDVAAAAKGERTNEMREALAATGTGAVRLVPREIAE